MTGTLVDAAVAAFDPTKQPAPQSFYVFAFMLVMLVLLLLSMLRHLRRARANLGDEFPAGTGAAPASRGGTDREGDLS